MPNRFAIVLALCSGAAAAQAQAPAKWDLPAAYPATNFHTENIAQFAREVEQASAGKLKITVHANASLFKAPEIKRAVQSGQAQAGEILLANYQNEWQGFGVDGLPFLASGYGEARKLYAAQKPVLEKKLASQGIKLLYAVAWPPQGLYARKPITALTDLKGSKWRAYSPATARIGDLIGAQPVTVQAAEQAFDALDKPTQDGVLKAAAAAEERGWKTSEQKDAEYIALLKKNGMEVLEPPAALKADMRRVIGEPMLAEWLKLAAPEGPAVVDAYRK